MKLNFPENPIFSDLDINLLNSYPDIQLMPMAHLHRTIDKGEKLIVIEENLEPNQVINCMLDKGTQYVVQKNKGRFESELLLAGKVIDGKDNYFDSNACLFEEQASAAVNLRFRNADDKQILKKSAMSFVEEIGSESVTQAADAIIEELYMNAVIDAPREAQKLNWNLSLLPCELYMARSEKMLQISCLDHFGSLDVFKVLRRMAEVYDKGAGQAINLTAGGGAGIGCILLFENSSTMIFGVKPKEKTKVTCLVPVGVSNRQRAQMKKSLHWFSV